MRTDDTITAIATASGRSARAIIRLSGPETDAVLRSLTGVGLGARRARPGRVTLRARGDAGTPDRLSLPVTVLSFPAPASYTGEDSAELLLPGNPSLVARALEAVLDAGARQAGPGEFTARAYLAGRLTLAQAEGVAAVIAAERDGELDAARRVLNGEEGARASAWADRLADLTALVEAGIDFTDQEDVVPIPPSELASALRAILGEIEGELGGRAATEAQRHEPTVALVGRPNAGKSTLFNALLGRVRAVTGDDAGTTRDVLDEPLDLSDATASGGVVRLLDLPGLDPGALGEIGTAAQRHARAAMDDAAVVVHCDPGGVFDSADLPEGPAVLRVRTKADLAGAADGGSLAVCALDGWHLDALRRAIADVALAHSGGDAVVPRHRRALAGAGAAIGDAISAIEPDGHSLHEPELVAEALRSALDAVGSVAGRVTPDDVLGRVFLGFCVGK